MRDGAYYYVAIGINPASSQPTPVSTPTTRPASSAVPITAGGFTRPQISDVQITDRIRLLPSTPVNSGPPGVQEVYRGVLVFAEPGGNVIKDAAGDAILIVATHLLSGDKQQFLDLGPQIIEDGVEKSAAAIINENPGDGVYWIYDVNQSSQTFLFVLPGGETLDLKPMIQRSPEVPQSTPVVQASSSASGYMPLLPAGASPLNLHSSTGEIRRLVLFPAWTSLWSKGSRSRPCRTANSGILRPGLAGERWARPRPQHEPGTTWRKPRSRPRSRRA